MPERELTITLRLAKAAAERAAAQFHEGERRRIKETGEAQEVFLKRWSSLWRRLQEAKVKGIQDGYKNEQKAAQETADLILRGAKKLNAAQIALMNRLREARIKGIQDAARDEEKRLGAVADLRKRLAQASYGAQLQIAKDTNRQIEKDARATADRLRRIALKEHNAQVGLLQELREARVQAAQAALQSQEDHDAKMKRARAHGLIQQIRDTEARIRAEVAADERAINEQLDHEKGLARARKDVRLKNLSSVTEAHKRIVQELDEFERKIDGDRAAFEESNRKVAQAKRNEQAQLEARQAAETARGAARKRVVIFEEMARRHSEVAREAAGEIKEIAERAAQYQKDGDTKAFAHAKNVIEQKSRVAKHATEESNRYAKLAAEELNATVEGLEGRHQRVQRGQFRERVDNARAYAKAARDSYDDAGKAATKAGDVQRRETKKTAGALEEQQERILNVSRAYTLMRIGAEVNQLIRAAFDATSRSAQESARYIERIVRDMEAMREKVAEILAMRGQPITGANAAGIARRAAANAISVESQVAFEETQEALSNEVLFDADADRRTFQGGRISRQAVEALGIPTLAASMGGGPAMQQAAARVADALIRSQKKGFFGRIDKDKLAEDFPAIMESVQLGRGGNAEAARQVSEAIAEFGGEGKLISDPRRVAALMRVFMLGNEKKGGTIFRGTMKGVLQVKNNDELMEQLRDKGMTGKEEGDEFFFKSLDAIRKIAKDEGEDYHKVLYRFYGELREFEGAELERLNRDIYKQSLKRMEGARTRAEKKKSDYRAGQAGRFEAARAGASAKQLAAADKFADLRELQEQAAGDIAKSGLMEEPSDLMQSVLEAARQQHIGISREEYENYQNVGGKIRAELQAQAERGSEKAQRQLEQGGFELEFGKPFIHPSRQQQALAVARSEAARNITPQERDNEMARRARLKEQREAEEAGRRAFGVTGEETAFPLPALHPMRVVLPPGIMGAAPRRRAGRGRLLAPPDHTTRMSRAFPILTDADRAAMAARRRAAAPAAGDVGIMGRVGAGGAYSAGMFAADPAHEMARLQIIGNHNFLGRYRERREATESDMVARSAGMLRRRNEIAEAFRSQVPPAMPAKPHVMRN